MKRKLVAFLFLTLFVVSCKESAYFTKGLDGANGADGSDGKNGKDGTSCSVSDEYDGESEARIGARISCTDGSFSLVLNGQNGAQGVQGPQGDQGIQGPVGQTGPAGASCQAYRSHFFSGVWLSCPHQFPVLISDGKDGKDGKDGEDGQSCSSTRQNSQHRVRITCGQTVTYVYDGQDGQDGEDGKDGKDGKSCTVTPAAGGANVKCGNGSPVFIANGAAGPAGTPGTPGAPGAAGQPGRDGLNGTNGEDAVQPGVSCNLHNLASWDGNTSLPQALANNPAVGSFLLANFSVPDSQASLGFPGMPANLRAIVGDEGYALDCYGYLNVPTSGTYTFKLLSDDGSRLVIEQGIVIQNQGLHAPATVSASLELQRGPNKINVTYYQGPYTQIALQLKWSGPNTAEQVVPASALTH